MGDTYVDSSFLLKLYLNEAESFSVGRTLRNLKGTAFVSKLIDVEVISSLQRQLSADDGSLVTRTYLANRASGLFSELAVDAEVFAVAVRIAQQQSKTYKLKSLDILHLATALRHAVPNVATFDKNMREAAGALGLAVVPA